MGVQVSVCNEMIVRGNCESQYIANEVFEPTENCCICGGGETMSQDLYDSIPEYEFKCRDSNYRMVQSDPDYDVIDVKADVSKNGNVMVTSVSAVHKNDLSRVTNVSVLSGAECYVRDDIQVYSG